MKNPVDKTIVYEIVLVIVAIVVMVVIGTIGNAITMGGMIGAGAMSGGGFGGFGSSRHSEVTIDPNSSLGKLDQYAKNMAEAGKKMEEAQKSGDPPSRWPRPWVRWAPPSAARAWIRCRSTQLKPFVPDTFAGLPRKDMRTERGGVQGFMTAKAEGVYNDGAGKSATLEVMDSGGAAGMLGLAGWANLQAEREDANHKESTRKEDDRLVHERLDKNSNYGEFTIVLGDRFVVVGQGQRGPRRAEVRRGIARSRQARGDEVGAERLEATVTPTWVRVAAGTAIASFFVLFLTGVFGYYDWWLIASAVFLVAFGAVWAYKLRHDRDA